MKRTFQSKSASVSRRSFTAGAGAAALVAGTAPLNIVRAQSGPLKVGVLLPRSGLQAGIGQDCQRGVDIADPIFKSLGLPELNIISVDTESNVDTARARAEKVIGDGAHLLVGAFNSGQTTAIAQVAEQKGVPLVINIAAAPAITEQGYKFVFRNFPPDATSGQAGVPLLDEDYLILSTIHSAKGQEWKSVFVLNVVDGCIPSDLGTGTSADRGGAASSLCRHDARQGRSSPDCASAFFTHGQNTQGDRHVYASRTRFIPNGLLGLFERTVWPIMAPGPAVRPVSEGVRVDVGARTRGMWR